MAILTAATCIMAIIFMIIIIFIGIWLFIIAIKAFNQVKYKNYILEKMYEKMDSSSNKKFTFDEFKYYLDLTKQNELTRKANQKISNVKDLEKYN